MNITFLPADKYMVINKTTLSELDRKNLVNLYEPIIGSIAVSLYLTLWRDLERFNIVSMEYTHHHLMTILKTSLEDIKKARITLEGVGLIRTYFEKGEPNNYVYELYSPLNAKEFFANPIFSVVLYNNIGSYEYDLLKKEYQVMKFDLKNFEEITSKFDEVYTSSSEFLPFEAIGRTTLPLNMQDQVDFDLLISSLPKGLVNEKAFNKKVRELINQLALIYDIDTLKMVEILRMTLNEKGFIDKDSLRLETRKYYQYNHQGKLPTLIYRTQPSYLKNPSGDTSRRGKIIEVFENTSPYDFLVSKYKGSNPTNRDLRVLEELLIDVGLTPAVTNVLIDYVLKKNNNKLNQSFIETIAGQWKRLGIKTADEAMEVAEKEHKKYTKKLNNDKEKANPIMPVWFNETISKEQMSKEEEEDLKSILEKYY